MNFRDSDRDIRDYAEEAKEAYQNGEGLVIESDEPEVQENGIEFKHPEQHYRVGGVTFECPNCGTATTSKCYTTESVEWTSDETREVAYCDECDIQYERHRQYLFDGVNVQEEGDDEYPDELLFCTLAKTVLDIHYTDRIHNTRYGCPYCSQVHYYTKPDGDWEKSHDNTVHGYEGVWINCECGSSLDWRGDRVCDECGREFELDVTQPDES